MDLYTYLDIHEIADVISNWYVFNINDILYNYYNREYVVFEIDLIDMNNDFNIDNESLIINKLTDLIVDRIIRFKCNTYSCPNLIYTLLKDILISRISDSLDSCNDPILSEYAQLPLVTEVTLALPKDILYAFQLTRIYVTKEQSFRNFPLNIFTYIDSELDLYDPHKLKLSSTELKDLLGSTRYRYARLLLFLIDTIKRLRRYTTAFTATRSVITNWINSKVIINNIDDLDKIKKDPFINVLLIITS